MSGEIQLTVIAQLAWPVLINPRKALYEWIYTVYEAAHVVNLSLFGGVTAWHRKFTCRHGLKRVIGLLCFFGGALLSLPPLPAPTQLRKAAVELLCRCTSVAALGPWSPAYMKAAPGKAPRVTFLGLLQVSKSSVPPRMHGRCGVCEPLEAKLWTCILCTLAWVGYGHLSWLIYPGLFLACPLQPQRFSFFGHCLVGVSLHLPSGIPTMAAALDSFFTHPKYIHLFSEVKSCWTQ